MTVNILPIALFAAIAVFLGILGVDLRRRGKFSQVAQIAKKRPEINVANKSLQSVIPLVTVVFPEDIKMQTEKRLAWAGIENLSAAEFLSVKLVAATGIPLVGALAGSLFGVPYIWFLVLAGVGYLAPDFWLKSRIDHRQRSIRKDMMEFATLFAVVLRAGGDMYGALRQVGQWFGGEMGKEVMRTAQDISTGKRRSEAMMDMAGRCGVDELTQMVQVILQADRYGTPIADAVQLHAAQVRVMRRYEAERIANEATVKMTLPMLLFFIGPLMFMLAYPAFQQLGKLLHR